MPILVTATKGGSGATVVAASTAYASTHDVVLIDTTGDLAAVVGGVPTDAVGVDDWLRSDAPVDRLDELALDITPHAALLPWSVVGGSPPPATSTRWDDLLTWSVHRERAGATVVIDAGDHADRLRHAASARDDADVLRCTELVVTRACYLALRPARRPPAPADAVVLVAEPGRTLRTRDVERSLGAPVVATVPWDPAIARAVDAGLSGSAVPRSMSRLGRRVVDACRSHGAPGLAAA